MTVDFSRDVMVGMLRKGTTGDEILQILNAIVPDVEQDSQDEYVADTQSTPDEYAASV